MHRITVHSPSLTTRRPVRARRAVAQDAPAEYSPDRQPSAWLVNLATVMGLVALSALIVAVVVV